MKISFVTKFDSNHILKWSGTPFYMSHAFEAQGVELERVGPLKKMRLPIGFKCKRLSKHIFFHQRDSNRYYTPVLKYYAKQVEAALSYSTSQIVLAPLLEPVAYLNCKQPIVSWTDALYEHLLGCYRNFSRHSSCSIAHGKAMTEAYFNRCHLAIFSSDWAARFAIEHCGAEKSKIKVVPFGANIASAPTFSEVKQMISLRPKNKIRLLFLGKDWHRKGGDIVLQVAKALHAAGHVVELNLVGCIPPRTEMIPSYVNCLGFIGKNTREGYTRIRELLATSHFLFVPSRAEAYGIVFCEANAFGLPCITSHIGGISTIVKEDINGKTFSLYAAISAYCDYIVNLMNHESHYQALALSSFHEFESRLNWKVATQSVLNLMRDIL